MAISSQSSVCANVTTPPERYAAHVHTPVDAHAHVHATKERDSVGGIGVDLDDEIVGG